MNSVEDRIEIHAEATEATIKNVLGDIDSGLILCDIEGAEFEVLTDEFLLEVSKFHLIVELHDHVVTGGSVRREKFLENASKYFTSEVLVSEDIPISRFRELENLPDDYRALAFSEGRPYAMQWVVLSPREE